MTDRYDSYTDHKVLKKAEQLKEKGLYPFMRAIENTVGNNVTINHKSQIMIGSNNYLGLTHHPYIQEKAMDAIKKYGTGCTGSRFLNGNLAIHEELEEKLAKFLGTEKVLLFSTGMQANLGAISAISGPRDCLVMDGENHASIIDAARLGFGTTFKFKHNNMESLEQVLNDNHNKYRNMVIVTDGVFSMTGDIVNLPKIVELSKKYNALIYIDDAHGAGVMGPRGEGTAHQFNLQNEIDLNMGTFSKSFASIGGFVSGPKKLINYVQHAARSFMFSASMPPSAVATVSACLDILKSDDSILKNLWSNVEFIKKGFSEIGLYTYNSQTPIVPVLIGDDIKAMQLTRFLEDHGVFATPVISPAVPASEALIRTSYMATHTKEELTKVLELFAIAKKEFNLPSNKFIQ